LRRALAAKSTTADEITGIARRDGHVRVIVAFQEPLAASAMSLQAPSGVANVKAQVAATQDTIIASHFNDAANPRAGQG
jgi:hypothetical protein